MANLLKARWTPNPNSILIIQWRRCGCWSSCTLGWAGAPACVGPVSITHRSFSCILTFTVLPACSGTCPTGFFNSTHSWLLYWLAATPSWALFSSAKTSHIEVYSGIPCSSSFSKHAPPGWLSCSQTTSLPIHSPPRSLLSLWLLYGRCDLTGPHWHLKDTSSSINSKKNVIFPPHNTYASSCVPISEERCRDLALFLPRESHCTLWMCRGSP